MNEWHRSIRFRNPPIKCSLVRLYRHWARGIFKPPIPTGVLEVEVFEDRNCRITWTAYQQEDLIYLHRLYPSVTVRDRDHEVSGKSQTFDTTVLFVSRLLIFKH